MNSTFAKKLPFTAKLFASVFAAGLLVAATGCSVEPNEEPDTGAASEDTDQNETVGETSQAASNNNCSSLNLSGVKGGAFRGGGQCCRTAYTVRGEAGGYCAKQTGWAGGSQCRYEVRFCGGWGCANNPEYRYTAPCR